MLSLYFHIGLWPIFLSASLTVSPYRSLSSSLPHPTLKALLPITSNASPRTLSSFFTTLDVWAAFNSGVLPIFLETPLSSLSPPIPYPAFIFCSSNPPPLYVGAIQLPACCFISFPPHTLHGGNIDWLVATRQLFPSLDRRIWFALENRLSGSMCLPSKMGVMVSFLPLAKGWAYDPLPAPESWRKWGKSLELIRPSLMRLWTLLIGAPRSTVTPAPFE